MSTALVRSELRISWLDRLLISFAPKWGLERVRARATAQLMARHFESASFGRRTQGWSRRSTDANAAASGQTLSLLRAQARDLVRNNPWARRGLRRVVTDTIGWGIRPKATGRGAKRIAELWKRWAETTECDAAGRHTFYGLERLVMRTVVESGEVLIRRRRRLPSDGLAIPLQLQVLEPDYIDTSKDGIKGPGGGQIIQGVEFDPIGRRVAYWLFDQHPGGRSSLATASKRVSADGVLHVFDQERPGQVRGPSWFASVDARLHEFDEFEDATLVKQKVAALMTAFVTDVNGDPTSLGKGGVDKTGQLTDGMEPGMIMTLPPGRSVSISQPPQATDHESFAATALRGVAAGIGTTYEDLTGDYSNVNYSSARMARIAHGGDVHDWRWNMIIPQFCMPTWEWMLDAIAGEGIEFAPAKWTPAPMAMLDPDKEGAAKTKAVRSGQMTPDEMVREEGFDPDEHWQEYAASFKRLDDLGITIDADPRKVSGAGQAQASSPAKTTNTDENAESKKTPTTADDGDEAAQA